MCLRAADWDVLNVPTAVYSNNTAKMSVASCWNCRLHFCFCFRLSSAWKWHIVCLKKFSWVWAGKKTTKQKNKDKFNIVCLWVFNLFPFQLFSHTCSRHLKVSLSLSLCLAASLPHRLHKLVFAWRRRRRRILVSKHGTRIVIFISDTSVPRTSPSLTRFSQHLTTESEMEKGTGRTRVRWEAGGGNGAPHKENTVRCFFDVSEGMRAVPCCGVCAFLFYFGGKNNERV